MIIYFYTVHLMDAAHSPRNNKTRPKSWFLSLQSRGCRGGGKEFSLFPGRVLVGRVNNVKDILAKCREMYYGLAHER